MFSTISRYISKKLWVQCSMYAGIGIAIIFLQQMLRVFKGLPGQRQSFLTLIEFTSLYIPMVLQTLLPIAMMLSVTTTLSTLNKRHELHIIHLTNHQGDILRATFLFGVISALFMLINSLFLVPASLAQAHTKKVIGSANMIAKTQKVGTFLNLENGLTLLVDFRRPNGEMEGFFMHDSRNPAQEITYQAQAATLIENGDTFVLALKNGTLQQLNTETNLLREVEFEIYSIDLTELFAQDIVLEMRLKEKSTAALMALWVQQRPDPVTTFMSRSGKKIERTFDKAAVQKEIHARLAVPLLAIGLPLFACACFGYPRLNRKKNLPAELIMFLVGFGILGVEQLIKDIAIQSQGTFWMIYSMPVFVIVMSLGLIYLRTYGWHLKVRSYGNKPLEKALMP